MNYKKYNKCILTLFIIFNLLFISVHAEETSIIPTVSRDKIFAFKFTEDINILDMSKDSIIVKDNKGNTVEVTLKMGKDKKTILIVPPVQGYNSGETYTVLLSTDISSNNNKNYINYNFKVEELGDIEDIYLEELYYLNYQSTKLDNGWTKWGITDKDYAGRTYDHGIKYRMDKQYKHKNWQYTEYLLNQNYSIFQGSIVVHYDNRSLETDTYIRIYGDDKLLFKSESLDNNNFSSDFKIDVMDVTKLKIEVLHPSDNDEDAFYGIVNAKLIGKKNITINAIEDYPKETPNIYLEDLDYVNYKSKLRNAWTEWAIDDKDSCRKTYNHGLKYTMTEQYRHDNWQYSEYLLDKKYSSFKGSFVIDYNNRSLKTDTYLRVYGDDKLLYTSEPLKASILPINFDIDVKGVTRLKIEIIQPSDSEDDGNYGIVNAGFYK